MHEEWEEYDGTPESVPVSPGETKVFFGEYTKKKDVPGPDGGVAIIVRTCDHEGGEQSQFYDLPTARQFVEHLQAAIEAAYQYNLDQWSDSYLGGEDE